MDALLFFTAGPLIVIFDLFGWDSLSFDGGLFAATGPPLQVLLLCPKAPHLAHFLWFFFSSFSSWPLYLLDFGLPGSLLGTGGYTTSLGCTIKQIHDEEIQVVEKSKLNVIVEHGLVVPLPKNFHVELD